MRIIVPTPAFSLTPGKERRKPEPLKKRALLCVVWLAAAVTIPIKRVCSGR